MIDYILRFSDEAEAISLLSDWRYDGENSAWAGGVLPVKVILQSAVWDGDATQIKPEIVSEGYWVGLAEEEASSEIWSLPNAIAEMDRDSGTIIRLRGFNLAALNNIVAISPVWAGSNYPWGSFAYKEPLP